MAKKSSKKQMIADFADIAEMIASTMEANGWTSEDLSHALSILGSGNIQDMYRRMYDYKQPDYSKMVEPLHPALVPVIEREGVDGLLEALQQALQTLRGIDRTEAGKALVNALYYILANQERLQEDRHTNLPLFAILHIMIELDVKGATPAIIELLSQDGYFYEFFFSAFEEDMSFAISKLCKDGLKELEDYMYATGRIPQTKYIVADGVIHMALIDPMVRLSVISWFARVLTRYADIVVYETNIDHIVKSLAQLNAKELKPLIERLYAVKKVPFIEIANKTELKRLLSKGTDERRIETESLADVIATVVDKYTDSLKYEDDDDDWDDEDDWGEWYDDEDDDWDDEDDDQDDEDREILVGEYEDGLLYRLDISLDNSPVEVSRQIIVPSNIRLSWLSRVLKIVMGWDGTHLDHFIKGREYYGAPDGWSTCEDYKEYSLNELLSRKSAKIRWEYDFGDSWVHTIKLVEKIKRDGAPVIEATKAVGACPPDDCGGVYGYAEMLAALKDKNHPEHDEWIEWIDEDFDPTHVSLDAINAALKPLSDFL